LGGSKHDDPETKKKGSRATMRKEEEKRNVMDRVVGIERGLSQQSRTTFGLMALNEESAAQAHRDMQMTGIMKRIETNTQLVEIRMSLWKELNDGDVKETMLKYITDLLEKGECLDMELEGMIAKGRNSNPIVNISCLMQHRQWDIRLVVMMKLRAARRVGRFQLTTKPNKCY
jgi:hypothetical protein